MVAGLVDTHAHLSDSRLWEDRAGVAARARKAGVRAILSVGYDRATSHRALELSRSYTWAGPAVGIHPTSLADASKQDFQAVAEWANLPEVVAIGETGLDFYWDPSQAERQREAFRWHLTLARRTGLPVTLHSRAAETAVLDEVERLAPPGGVMHCFGGSREEARRALELGLYLGIDGPVTFRKATELHELVRWLPLDRMVLETDSPYLSPQPHRGDRNEPAYLCYVAEAVAALRGAPAAEIAATTTANAFRLYPRLAARAAGPDGDSASGAGAPGPEGEEQA